MANVINNCYESEVTLSVGLLQFILSGKLMKSNMCPQMSV